MKVVAIAGALGVFVAVLRFEGLSRVFEPIWQGVYAYKVVVIAIAMSPLAASSACYRVLIQVEVHASVDVSARTKGGLCRPNCCILSSSRARSAANRAGLCVA